MRSTASTFSKSFQGQGNRPESPVCFFWHLLYSKSSNMIKLVVFDMAGTTINEDNVVYKTLLTAINKKDLIFRWTRFLRKVQEWKNHRR